MTEPEEPTGAEPESDPPASEPPAAEPEPTPTTAAPAPAEERGPEKGDTVFGVKVHNLIFVGLILGIILGLLTYGIDHFDKLVLQPGVTDRDGNAVAEIAGRIHKKAGQFVVMTPQGVEHRFPAEKVKEHVKVATTPSGEWYASLVWWFNFFGKTLFMSALKMIIAPLILASIVAGIVSLTGLDQLKRIGLKTLGYYVCTTFIAVSIGLVLVLIIRPGHKAASKDIRKQREYKLETRKTEFEQEHGVGSAGSDANPSRSYLEWLAEVEAKEAGTGHEAGRFAKLSRARGTTPGDILKDSLIKPMLTNPFYSLTHAKSLGIISFALLLGIAIVVVGPPGRTVAAFFVGLNDVIILITKWLMSAAPFCVMCIVAELVAVEGPQVFATLAWYCVTVVLGILCHVGVLLAIASTLGGCSPLRLWNGLREALLIAFTTRSSAATLPVTMRCVINQLKVSPRVANFALPVGATMNMDGTALYEGVAVIFLIQIYAGMADVPIVLGGAVTLLIFVTAVMASVGAAAVPDAGLVTMVLVAEAVGLPVYYIPLIFAVDAFLDMFRTTTNVLGDSVGCLVVQRWEGQGEEPFEESSALLEPATA